MVSMGAMAPIDVLYGVHLPSFLPHYLNNSFFRRDQEVFLDLQGLNKVLGPAF